MKIELNYDSVYDELNYDGSYFYEIIGNLNTIPIVLLIASEMVRIDYLDGRSIITNICPRGLFPKQKSLSIENLKKVVSILESTGFEGKRT